MSNKYSIYYENKIIATAWLTEKAESEFQLATIRPEGYVSDQPFTEKITLIVPATLIGPIAIERAIHLYGLDAAAFTITPKDTIEPLFFMNRSTPNFPLEVEGVKGVCPAGENWAKQNIIEKKIPVLSCEGPCIRGEIARLAANIVAKEEPYARSCYAEVALVPHSSMAQWVKEAEKIIMIDGCFLKCVGRILNNLVDEEKIVNIDALPLYKRYTDVFLMDDVPEAERKEVAYLVADKILDMLKESYC